MKVRLATPTAATDKYYLINLTEFMCIVDQNDLSQRKSEKITDSYHKYWLPEYSNGIYLFHPPEFYLLKGIAGFINGRHRTLVLHKHLTEIPMALTSMDLYPTDEDTPHKKSLDALKRIKIRELHNDEVFEFPDLPIKYLGYDDNIGK